MGSEGLETIVLPHLEQYPIFAALFEDVKNAAHLRDQLLQGNTDFEYTFLDASMIACRDHLLAACVRSIYDMACDRLKTRNVHSEIVFALSPNNNIAESFRRFGLSPGSKNIIALKVATNPSVTCLNVSKHLEEQVRGTRTTIEDDRLARLRDVTRLRKIYKFDAHPSSTDGDRVQAGLDERKMLLTILGAMALRGL